MAFPAFSGSASGAIEASLRDDLAVADRAMVDTGPILRHLLRSNDTSMFSDEIVARVRGMFRDVARQLVVALAEAAGHAEPHDWAPQTTDSLADVLADNPVFIGHFHALALEWQLTERLHAQLALDPVLPPLLQTRIAAPDPADSALAMALLAAQARFGQAQRRMQMPLSELPGDLHHIALVTMRTFVGDDSGGDGYALVAERTLRSRFDEQRGRQGLLRSVLRAMEADAAQALSVEQAGVALFLTALATGSSQSREAAILATTDVQLPRMMLSLCACGLGPEAIAVQFAAIHPDITLPEGIADISPDNAGAILAEAAARR